MTWRTLLFTVVSLSSASAPAAQQPLRVAGTGSAVAAMTRVGAEAESRDPFLHVRVLPSLGSTGAIRAAADGAIDLAVSGRPLRDSERALGLVAREVARTPFLYAVGPRVVATSLTTDDLASIYQGTLLTWPDGQRIRVVLRPPSDADTDIIRSISPEVASAVDAASRRPGMLLAVTNTDCNEILARSPGSVGPTSLLQLRAEAHPLRALRWNGIEPTLENLASGRYPLGKSVYLIFRAPAGEGVRRILAYIASPAGRALLGELGALPVDFPPIE